MAHPNQNKRAVFGWTMYDWANSVYALTITTAIFPEYFHGAIAPRVALNQAELEAAKLSGEHVDAVIPFLGMELKSVGVVSLCFAIAYLMIALFSPILGGIADYSGHKKKFMMGFTTLGAASCAGLWFFDASTYEMGLWLFILAAFGYAGGNIFNDAFLPEITTPDQFDKVSARGFSMGYVGSLILLVFNLLMLMQPGWFFDMSSLTPGEAELKAVKWAFLSVGIWWFGFAQITFFSLKDVRPPYQPANPLLQGFHELGKVLSQLKNLTNLRWYLLAFLAFNMGLQTVMYMAASFGKVEIGLTGEEMIILMLLIHIIAIPGSFLFAWMSGKWGNLRALLIGIGMWVGILVIAWFSLDVLTFYIVGGLVGIVMGGMQALSRATYSKLLPQTKDTASFFSFYSITDKIAIVGGTATFAFFNQSLGTRNAILALEAYFLIGGILIFALMKRNVKL